MNWNEIILGVVTAAHKEQLRDELIERLRKDMEFIAATVTDASHNDCPNELDVISLRATYAVEDIKKVMK